MALILQSENPSPRNRFLSLLGWLLGLHGCALALLYAFAAAVGLL